jgi:hypothetical protein
LFSSTPSPSRIAYSISIIIEMIWASVGAWTRCTKAFQESETVRKFFFCPHTPQAGRTPRAGGRPGPPPPPQYMPRGAGTATALPDLKPLRICVCAPCLLAV